MLANLSRGRVRLSGFGLWACAAVLAALLGIVLLVQGRAGRAYGYRSQVSADNSAFAFLTSPFRRPASAGRWGRISPPVVGPEEHPMAALMREGEKRWHALLARQSTSLEQAVKEYQRRYGRRPPKGFDLWYRWSTERGLKLVDEFDRIDRDLAPFWGLSPQQIESRREELRAAESHRVLLINIQNGNVSDEPGPASHEIWPVNKDYWGLFTDFSEFLPDMNITVNSEDSPMSFVSWDERERLIEAGKRGIYAPDEEEIPLPAEEVLKQPRMFSWRDLLAACPPDAPAHRWELDASGEDLYSEHVQHEADSAYQLDAAQGSFVFDNIREGDACYNPKISKMHGNFIRPVLGEKLRRNRLYPIFSWSTHHQTSDITVPTTFRFDNAKLDPGPWGEKIPKVTWRGQLTDVSGDASVDRLSAQRFRLWRLMSETFARVPLYLAGLERGRSIFRMSSILAGKVLDRWTDVGPTNLVWRVAESDRFSSGLSTLWGFAERQNRWERDKHKIILDVDGHGWSARYRELMRSASPVLKATTYFEIFTDWLIPWYHFIPLSYDYHEFFSILGYFFGLDEADQPAHDEELQMIGEHGRAWTIEHGNWDHHASYTFRLCLEWARICSDDRSTMDFDFSKRVLDA